MLFILSLWDIVAQSIYCAVISHKMYGSVVPLRGIRESTLSKKRTGFSVALQDFHLHGTTVTEASVLQ